MKKLTFSYLCIFLIVIFPLGAMAADYIAEADKLFEQGGLDNYIKAIELYQKEPGFWISEILDDIVMQVILGNVENDYIKIRQYLLSKN